MDRMDELIMRYPALAVCREDIRAAYALLVKCFSNGGGLYVCGNGGSAADALHIVGELAKSFVLRRELDEDFRKRVDDAELLGNLQGALPAHALAENVALATAFANDVNAEYVFAQQVYAYARAGDCVLGISTSGNSKNVLHALAAAKGRKAITIGLTGGSGGGMKAVCDRCVCVPETETHKIQELHLPVYHSLCLMLEERFFGAGNK
ncbi:MAG: SIS domain-containing protein [Clostridiales Family XIII bacterium]|nr:SIS domain-containing protein [Clostridiales Family XIII bacterium]